MASKAITQFDQVAGEKKNTTKSADNTEPRLTQYQTHERKKKPEIELCTDNAI